MIDQAAICPQAALGAGHGLEDFIGQPAAVLAIDFAAVHLDGQAVGLRPAKEFVARGPLDDMALVRGAPLQPEHIGEALHAVRLGRGRLRMRLAGRSDRFGAEVVFSTDEGQQVAEFGGIEHNLRAKADCSTILEIDRCHGT